MTLKGDKRFIEENEVLLQELELCAEDIRFEINIYLEEHYLPESGKVIVLQTQKKKKSVQRPAEFNQILKVMSAENIMATRRV